MKSDLRDKIQTRGYWRVHFRPASYAQRMPMIGACKSLVLENKIQLRGWNYPFAAEGEAEHYGIDTLGDCCQGWIEWENHLEFWRMYQSGQFIHYVALREDGIDQKEFDQAFWGTVKVRNGVSVTGVIYELTEIFQFLSRLVAAGTYDDGVHVSIGLMNTKERQLVVDRERADFFAPKKTSATSIEFLKTLTKEESVMKAQELPIEAARYFFDRFGWHDPSDVVIRKTMEDLLYRRGYSA